MRHARQSLAIVIVLYAAALIALGVERALREGGAPPLEAALTGASALFYLVAAWRLRRRERALVPFLAAVALDRGGLLWPPAAEGAEGAFIGAVALAHLVTAALALAAAAIWRNERSAFAGPRPVRRGTPDPASAAPALPPVELVETDIGRFLLFAGADLVSDSLRRRGEWEPATLDVARRLLEADGRRGGVVVDCGANVGAFTIPVARMLPSTGMVVSFEVQRAVYHQLCGAVVLNRLSNVIVHNVGLAAGPGRASVPVPDYHSDRNIGGVSLDPDVRRLRGGSGLGAPTDHGAVVLQEVELRPLDAFELGDVRLLKIDVEGMELSVLRGAVSTLERSGWPPVLFELWDIGALPAFAESQRELLRFVSGLGYEVQRVGDLGVAQHAGRAMKLDLGPEGARPV